MARTLMIFMFLAYCWGCDARFMMTQPPSVSASIGETVEITCKKNGGSLDRYDSSWYQQKPGSSPVLLIYRDASRASGISTRFSGSTDASALSATLTISNVRSDDEADYYCLYVESGNERIFGAGTQLTVTGQPASRPTMNVFPPSQEELRTTDKATLACLVSDFMPGAAQVIWLADGSPISSGVETTKPTKHNDKYMLSSYLTMPSSEWEKHNEYTCKVTHEGSEYRKTVNRSQ